MKEMIELEEEIWKEMQKAVDAKDVATVSLWEPIIAEAQSLRGNIERVESIIASSNTVQNFATGRSAVWSVTQAAIDNNYLSVGVAMKAGLLPPSGTSFSVKTATGRAFTTEEVSYHLRERGEIARFYRDAKIKEGDKVEWCEIVPSKEYYLQKK